MARHAHRRWLRDVAMMAALLAASCAPTTRHVEPIAPSYATIVAVPEDSDDGIHELIYIVNNSTVPVIITGIRLSDCENVVNSCGLQQMRILINPNQRMLVATIGPVDRGRPYNFHYSWTWVPAK